MNMTSRQRAYFRMIVEEFIATGIPVSSHLMITRNNLEVSSATVRNEMNKLEIYGLLQKSHTSSGRVPTVKGYKLYADYVEKKQNKNLTQKIKDIFATRRASIDLTLDKAVSLISEMANMTLVTRELETSELLKSIQLTPLNKQFGTIVLVTSAGRVESKLIEFTEFVSISDVRIAIRIFKERLIDVPLKDLFLIIDSLRSILSETVKNYDAVIETFVMKIFDFHNRSQNKVYGNSKIIKSKEIKREDLAKLIDLIENKSVWSTIEGQVDDDQQLKIAVRDDNTSIISQKVQHQGVSKEISIVGSNRIDYAEAKQIVDLLAKLLSGQ